MSKWYYPLQEEVNEKLLAIAEAQKKVKAKNDAEPSMVLAEQSVFSNRVYEKFIDQYAGRVLLVEYRKERNDFLIYESL